jgi:chondroitin AC lyase
MIEPDRRPVLTRYRRLLLRADAPSAPLPAWPGADGAWPDVPVDYSPTPGLPAEEHLARIGQLALAWAHPASPLHQDAELLADLTRALRHWQERDPLSANWWFNSIGVPLHLAPVLALLADALSADLAGWIAQRLRRAYRDGQFWIHGLDIRPDGTSPHADFPKPSTGQNTIWMARAALLAADYETDADLARVATAAILNELRIQPFGTEGIQADLSFHQHGPLLYTNGYGRNFAADLAEIAWLVHDTPHAFPAEKLALLADYIAVGHGWTWWGPYFDFGANGREISRANDFPAAARIFAARVGLLAEVLPKRAAPLHALSATLRSEVAPASGPALGNRYFYRSDWMVHRCRAFFASVRLTSDRIRATETGNGENLLGGFLGDGVVQFLRRGDEYLPIVPLWNWRQLPGLSIAQNNAPPPQFIWGRGAEGLTPWAAGASDGEVGVAAFRSLREGVEIWKSWFFVGDTVTCLGAGLHAPHATAPIVTTLDQRASPADPVVASPGEHPAWVWHDGLAYIFEPDNAPVRVSREHRIGDSAVINSGLPARRYAADIFTLALDHGPAPGNGAYAYHVALAETPDAIAALPRPRIVANTATIQAVADPSGTRWLAAFHAPGEITLAAGSVLRADQPAVVIITRTATGWTVHAAHPVATVRRLAFTLVGRDFVLEINPSPEHAGQNVRYELAFI